MRRPRAAHTSRTGRLLAAIALFVTGVLHIAPGTGRAATLDVCPSGCTYASIAAAVADATAGDVIAVGAGVYDEVVVLTVDLTVVGAGAATTIVDGGGVGTVITVPAGVSATVTDLTVTGGTSVGDGGGIANAGTLTVRRVAVAGNTVPDGGGGIFNTGTLVVEDSTITDNTGMTDGTGSIGGGGIASAGSSASATVRRSTIARNTLVTPGTDQRGGGGIAAVLSDLTVEDSTIEDNRSGYSSGGIYVAGSTSTFTLARSTVRGNATGTDPGRATGRGGGISIRSSATASISESAIVDNTSASSGAGVHAAATTTIVNSTISGNVAETAGGGIHAEAAVSMAGVTIIGNTAGTFGGGVYGFGLTIPADSAIVAGNVAATDGSDCYATIAAAAGTTSLIGQTDATICVAGGAGSILTGIDPQLAPLADNGGPTPSHLPEPGSPVIDATTTTLTTDQRGLPRPAGSTGDIGSIEVQPVGSGPPFELIPAWGGGGSAIGARAIATGEPTPTCGWAAGETVELWWDDPEVVLGSATVEADGCWEIVVVDTAERTTGAALGRHKVIARGVSGESQAPFELVERSLALSPTIASAERQVAVGGCGWAGASDVNVYWAATGELIGRSIALDGSGCLAGVVDIPAVRSNGLYPVVAAEGAFPGPEASADASATVYEVRPASVFLTPPAGPPGGRVELAGCGWLPNEEVEFRSLADDLVFDVVATVESGCFRGDGPQPLTISIPPTATLGRQVLRAAGARSGQQIDSDFEVLEPFVAFDPSSGSPGSIVSVTGCGWAGNDRVTLEWEYTDTNNLPIRWSHPVERTSGCLAEPGLSLEVPANSPAGGIRVEATGDVSGSDVVLFEVVSGGTMTLLQTTAEAGGTVPVQITGATVGEVISFRFGTQFGDPDDGVGIATPDVTVDVDVPADAIAGATTLYAEGTKGFTASAPLQIVDTSTLEVLTSPLAANVLTDLTGSNWGSGERIAVSIRPLGGDDASRILIGSTTVGADTQSWSATVRLPDDLPDGAYELEADGDRGRLATVAVDLVSPTLAIDPTAPAAGTSIDVTGAHWAAGELVLFSLRSAMGGDARPVAPALRADGTGRLDGTVGIPFGLDDGSYDLIAIGETGRSATTAVVVGERAVTLTITEVNLLATTFDGADTLGDMYARLRVDAAGFPTTDVDFRDEHTVDMPVVDTRWTHTFRVPASSPQVMPVEVSLFDWDSGADPASEQRADINPDPNNDTIVLPIDLRDGTWAGGPLGQSCTRGDAFDAAVEVCFVTTTVSDTGDLDDDGFLDRWEIQGIDRDGDGTAEIDLPDMGADPCRQTIVVEYSSMISPSGISYRPTANSVDSVVTAFDVAPIDAPLDCGSWLGAAGAGVQLLPRFVTYELYQAEYGCADLSADRDRRQTGLRARLFYYAMFVDRRPGTTSTGVACGDGAIIISLGPPSLNAMTRLVQESSTFMHELGHALGLWHGGDENRNYKPNYLSVMNYRFQLAGQFTADGSQFVLDYSREELSSLDEGALVEEALTTSDLETVWSSASDPNVEVKGAADAPIDWNGDGPTPSDEPYGQDLNTDSWCVLPGEDDVLDTAPATDSDDMVASDLNSGQRRIWAGADGTCDTAADETSDDTQFWEVGDSTWTTLRSHDDWDALNLRARNNRRGAGLSLDRIPEDPEPTIEQLEEQFELWFSPSLTADDRTVTTTVGSAAVNTGTVGDRDGDTPTLSASIGQVTDIGDGRWSWTDVPTSIGDQLVTITAIDDDGMSSVSFLVTADGVSGGSLSGTASFEWPGTGDNTLIMVNVSAPTDGDPTGSLLVIRSGDDPVIARATSLDGLVTAPLSGGGTSVEVTGRAAVVLSQGGIERELHVRVRVDDRGRGDDLVTVEIVDDSGAVVATTDGQVEVARGDLDAATR